MKYNIGFIALIVSLFIMSCESDDTTRRGYDYEFHKDEKGTPGQPGEYVKFNVVMAVDDSVIMNSRDMGDQPMLQIVHDTAYTAETPHVLDLLEKMSVGDSATLYFPLDSLPARPPAFENYEMVTYHMGVEDILSEDEYQTFIDQKQAELEAKREGVRARKEEVASQLEQILQDYKGGNLKKMNQMDNGLEYVVLEEGAGDQVDPGDVVSVHYYGVLEQSGELFDASFNEGDPFVFPLGQGRVIPGWDIGISELKEGSKAVLFVPYQLAYGEQANRDIPAKSDLVFYVEVENVQ